MLQNKLKSVTHALAGEDTNIEENYDDAVFEGGVTPLPRDTRGVLLNRDRVVEVVDRISRGLRITGFLISFSLYIFTH